MKRLAITLSVLAASAAAATHFSISNAGAGQTHTTAAKIVTRIDLKGRPEGGNPQSGGGTFTLHSGKLTDRGSSSYSFSAAGQKTEGTITLTGKKGSLTLQTTSRPSGLHVDGNGLDLWVGTWKVAAADGAYKGAHGVGAYVAIIGPAYAVAFRFEGFRS
jgi:hypothetical protein